MTDAQQRVERAFRFESQFAPLLRQGRLLTVHFDRAFTGAFPAGFVPGSEFPAGSVNRLMISTLPVYEAAIACLREAATSLGAFALMRTLLETWAHLHFIAYGDPSDSMECRAIRIDLGTADMIIGLFRDAATSDTPEAELERAHQRREPVFAAYEEHRCAGPPRSYRGTLATLKEMTARPGYDWLTDAYRASSMIIHSTSFDWSLRPGPNGEATVGAPRPSHRAARLNHLVVAFGMLAQLALAIVGAADRGHELDGAVVAVLDSEFLRQAIEGEFD